MTTAAKFGLQGFFEGYPGFAELRGTIGIPSPAQPMINPGKSGWPRKSTENTKERKLCAGGVSQRI